MKIVIKIDVKYILHDVDPAFNGELRPFGATFSQRRRAIKHNIWIGSDSNH
jgi:hypothetical protein